MKSEMLLDDRQVATLAATFGVCTLIGLERHLPPHALLARRIKDVEVALFALAKLGGKSLDQKLTDAASVAWGHAMHKLAEEVGNG